MGLSDRGVPGMLRKAELEIHRLHAVMMVTGQLDRRDLEDVIDTLRAVHEAQGLTDAVMDRVRSARVLPLEQRGA